MATISDWQLHGIVTSTDNVQHVSARRRTECEMKIRPYASRLWLSPSESWKKIIIGQRHLCDFVLLRHIHKKTFDQIYNKSNAKNEYIYIYFFILRNSPQWARASSFRSILDHTQRHTTFGRTPLDKWSARRRHLYLTTHNTHNKQTSMPLVRFFSSLSWRLFTTHHVSGVFPPIIRISMTAVAASGFTFVSWW